MVEPGKKDSSACSAVEDRGQSLPFDFFHLLHHLWRLTLALRHIILSLHSDVFTTNFTIYTVSLHNSPIVKITPAPHNLATSFRRAGLP